MTNTLSAFRLDRVGVVDFTGQDRVAIVHNLTTNEIKSLATDHGCETFVTDVRGKALAHVMLYAMSDRMRLIGPHGFSTRIAEHADRYTIREDAVPCVRDEDFAAIVLSPEATEAVISAGVDANHLVRTELRLGAFTVDAYPCHWLGKGSTILLGPTTEIDDVAKELTSRGVAIADESEFQSKRTEVGFPWYGVDIDESNLPQEADRDSIAISFTKGCYLGQETIARLDALGQVQKKLVRWKIEGGIDRVAPGTTLDCDGKTVGRLTSVANGRDGTIFAIGFARRSHFGMGSEAKGTDEVSGDTYCAYVIG